MAPSAKIIIRPRRARQRQTPPEVESDDERPTRNSDTNEDTDQNPNEEDGQDEDNDNNDGDVEMESGKEDNEDGDAPDDDEAGGGDDVEEVPFVHVPRPRGRPRGRGRPPSGRPRGRPRGSGRGRGRPRGRGGPILLRLPKRGADSDAAEGDGEGSESQAATPGEVEEDEAVREALSGGKPFRKINGQVYIIEGDEFVTENDPKGDTKIDADGNLLGGTSLQR